MIFLEPSHNLCLGPLKLIVHSFVGHVWSTTWCIESYWKVWRDKVFLMLLWRTLQTCEALLATFAKEVPVTALYGGFPRSKESMQWNGLFKN